MIILDCEQYTDEWWDARLGIPTSSIFEKIVSSTGKKTSQWDTVAYKLAAEVKRGKPDDSFKSEWMKRGTELEPDARVAYEFLTDTEVREVGLVYMDERKLWSCSPDGLPSTRGLEIKCPSPGVHMQNLHKKKIPTKYKPQVYGSLWICDEVEAWDWFSYHPEFDHVLIRTTRSDDDYKTYAQALDKYMPKFVEYVAKIVEDCK